MNEEKQKYLIELLNRKETNIVELSIKTGISKVSLYNIKNGRQKATERTYRAIIDLIGDNNQYTNEFKNHCNSIKNELSVAESNSAIIITKNEIMEMKNFKILF